MQRPLSQTLNVLSRSSLGGIGRFALKVAALGAVTVTLAGCDKCGKAVPFYAPWQQGSCHGEPLK